MKVTISSRYLELPVSDTAQTKTVTFSQNGHLMLDLAVQLDPVKPEMTQFADMRHFLGMELDLCCEPAVEWSPRLLDTPPSEGVYRERLRPRVHFSASRGWINDPNGLVWYEGLYHLFFQYNPAGSVWGNMHWGHAVSTDLVHWKEREIALFPDETGTMFSGSAVVDFDNRTGLQEGSVPVILLFYTAAGGSSRLSEGQPFTQCLAYSTDGGETFRKYARNPLIPLCAEGNRDPKVHYDAQSDTHLLALYLIDHQFAVFRSKNLLDWEMEQEIELPGDRECPDLYPLPLEGEERWVFSGASDRYFVGSLKDGRFWPEQLSGQLHYGKNSYAAQTFSNLPETGRIVRMAWNTSPLPHVPFQGAMCTPAEMTLRRIDGKVYLCTWPVRELKALERDTRTVTARAEAGKTWEMELDGAAQDIQLTWKPLPDSPFRMTLFGLEIKVLPGENSLVCKDCTMPLYAREETVRLRILTDTHSTELYADQGEAHLCIAHIVDFSLSRLELHAEASPVQLTARVSRLASVWETEGQQSDA